MTDDAAGSSSNLVVSADPVSDDEDAGPGDTTIVQEESDAEGEADGKGEDGVDEPEDDYNAAWEVLDVARTIYSKTVEGLAERDGREERLCLAECYLSLGDVSCETGQFNTIQADSKSNEKQRISPKPC